MDSSYGKISQVKLIIKKVIDSLQQMNHVENQNVTENIIANTECLLSKLEKYPLKCIRSKINRRRRQRLQKKLNKLKEVRQDLKPITDIEAPIERSLNSKKFVGKSNHISKSIEESKRFLQTFELLEQLHLLRSQNSSETCKFSLNLGQLKLIWNSILQDNLKDQTSKEIEIQQQWNKVLFGPPEKTYFDNAPNLHDFMRKREVWDSYINSKYGTSIPIGWIVPRFDVKELWKPYHSPMNF